MANVGYYRSHEPKFENPRTPDPYEKTTILVREDKKTGEGLFTRRKVHRGELLAYYSGYIMSNDKTPIRIFRNFTTLTERFNRRMFMFETFINFDKFFY